ncbi:MAG: hypothetical protein IH892_20245 [Planctomycetes bacterium]|nr:hypothetical protein [Planctomycetota bacterium]
MTNTTSRLASTAAAALFTFCAAAYSGVQVNRHPSNDQKDVQVASNGQAHAITVWNSYNQDGNSGGIFGQLVKADGRVSIDEFQIHDDPNGNQAEPAVAMNTDGSFLVAWKGPSEAGDAHDIHVSLFDASGQRLSADTRVNDLTADTQRYPRVAPLTDSRFIVTWESRGLPDRSNYAIAGRIIGPQGTPVGPEMTLSDTSTTARYADVATNSLGNMVVVWMEDRSTDSIRARLFDPNGVSLGDSFVVNSERFRSITWPSVAMGTDGSFVVVWDGDTQRASDDDIHARKFAANGEPASDQFRINTTLTGPQRFPVIALDEHNAFQIAWQSQSDSPDLGQDVYIRQYDADCNAIGGEISANQHLMDDQQDPAIAYLGGGRFLTAWESEGQDGSGTGIFSLVLPEPLSADYDGDGFVDFQDYGLLARGWLQREDRSAWDLTGDGLLNDSDLIQFCLQWLGPLEPAP